MLRHTLGPCKTEFGFRPVKSNAQKRNPEKGSIALQQFVRLTAINGPKHNNRNPVRLNILIANTHRMQFPLKMDARFLKKSYAKRMFYGAWKLAVAYLFILIFVGVSYSDPELRGWCIFFLAIAGVGTAIFVAAWFRQSKSIDDWVSRQGDVPVVYALSEEVVESTSQLGSTKLKWDAFSSLAISDFDTLLMFPRSAGALTLPTDQVPSPALDYLKTHFAAIGKKVEDKRKKGDPVGTDNDGAAPRRV